MEDYLLHTYINAYIHICMFCFAISNSNALRLLMTVLWDVSSSGDKIGVRDQIQVHYIQNNKCLLYFLSGFDFIILSFKIFVYFFQLFEAIERYCIILQFVCLLFIFASQTVSSYNF